MRIERAASGNVEILAMGKCDQGHQYIKLQIRIGGRIRRRVIPLQAFELAPDRTIAALEAGLVASSTRADLRRRVERASQTMKPSFLVATRPGLYGGSFVMPNGTVFGDESLQVSLPSLYDEIALKCGERGTLLAWQRIPELAVGNSRFMMTLAWSFTGPIALLLGVESPGIQLVGPSGAGKTGIAGAAGSALGGRDGEQGTFVEGWNHTKNNIEKVAAAHSAFALILDDTRLFDRSNRKGFADFCEAIMRLAEGRIKGRYEDVGDPIWFQTSVLSTSNDSLDQMARDVGVEIDDALRGRLIDVPLVTGVLGAFEDLHGYAHHGAFTAELKRIARENYGVPFSFFLQKLVPHIGRNKLRLVAWLNARRANYERAAHSRIHSAWRDVVRFHGRFATIYAAGCLAIQFGILPWRSEALLAALLVCEQAHFEAVGVSLADR